MTCKILSFARRVQMRADSLTELSDRVDALKTSILRGTLPVSKIRSSILDNVRKAEDLESGGKFEHAKIVREYVSFAKTYWIGYMTS